jgi:flagellar P-ring protein precursor FlgI
MCAVWGEGAVSGAGGWGRDVRRRPPARPSQLRIRNALAFNAGETVMEQRSAVGVEEEKRPMFLMEPGPKLADVVKAVNAIGASPADLVAILEALKEAGALKAELIIL